MVLPYIGMNSPRVYMSSQSWTPLPPPIPYHLSGSSPCTSPKHPVSCIEHRLAIRFLHDSIHVSSHSPKSSHPLPLPQSPKVCSLHLCFFCCKKDFLSEECKEREENNTMGKTRDFFKKTGDIKRLFYTSVSLLLSHIQGYHYHLSKLHIYVLVYCIGVFLSGLLHSV